jgi:hypothetical protein
MPVTVPLPVEVVPELVDPVVELEDVVDALLDAPLPVVPVSPSVVWLAQADAASAASEKPMIAVRRMSTPKKAKR